MEKVSPNTIYVIVDTIDGPEEEAVNLDDLSLEQVRDLAQEIPGLYKYLIVRSKEEHDNEDKSSQ